MIFSKTTEPRLDLEVRRPWAQKGVMTLNYFSNKFFFSRRRTSRALIIIIVYSFVIVSRMYNKITINFNNHTKKIIAEAPVVQPRLSSPKFGPVHRLERNYFGEKLVAAGVVILKFLNFHISIQPQGCLDEPLCII